MADSILDFAEFRTRLAQVFDVPEELLQAETNFLEDLAFDSLRMLQLGMIFEDLGVMMPDGMAWEIQTVGEAYAYYLAQASAVRVGEPDTSD